MAEENYEKALAGSEQLNWRLTDAMANFYERHGRDDEAQALYQRFSQAECRQRTGESVLGGTLQRRRPAAD